MYKIIYHEIFGILLFTKIFYPKTNFKYRLKTINIYLLTNLKYNFYNDLKIKQFLQKSFIYVKTFDKIKNVYLFNIFTFHVMHKYVLHMLILNS